MGFDFFNTFKVFFLGADVADFLGGMERLKIFLTFKTRKRTRKKRVAN